MNDDPFAHWSPAPTVPRPSEKLFKFVRGVDRFACELRYRAEWGVEAWFLRNEELFISHRFDTRALAVQWAERAGGHR